MYFQGSSRRGRGEDGIAMVVDFLLSNARLVLGVGGAAILGIATLAVKRLIERAGRAAEDEKVEQKMKESWEELGLVSASPTMIRKGLEGVVMKHVAKAAKQAKQKKGDLCQQQQVSNALEAPPALEPKPKKIQLCVLTLQERLQQYYDTRAALGAEEVSRAQRLALDICTEIQSFLHTRHPDMPLEEMSLGGSLLDDLQVVSADHACLLVPLQLESSLWRLVPGEETLLTHPLHWMVRRVNLEYFPRGRSYWDRFLVGGYLSSEALVNMLNKAIIQTMNWPCISSTMDCLVRPVPGVPELHLEIQPGEEGSGEQPLFISILPLIREGDVVLTGQPELTSPWVNAWHLSLYPWETQRLAQLDAADADHSGCRRHVLKTLKAVCRLNPALRPLPAAPLANLILHLSDSEGDWSRGAVDVRFQQCITELIGYLEQGAMHSYFKPAVNLLSGLSEEQVDQIGFMLYCAVSEPEVLLI